MSKNELTINLSVYFFGMNFARDIEEYERRDLIKMKPNYETKTLKTDHYTLQLFLDYFNERIRVDNYRGNVSLIVKDIHEITKKHEFTKIIFYSRPEHWKQLLREGFELEAVFTGFFNGTDAYAMTSYKHIDRKSSNYWINEDNTLQTIIEKGRNTEVKNPPTTYRFRQADVQDTVELANLYGTVFEIYPTPMNEPEYLRQVMSEGNLFYVVEYDKKIVSAASADVNLNFHNAELTDCATLPEHRKYGLMKKLLVHLEEALKEKGIYCAYSIARALSFGMNAAFYQLGYEYGGRMTNNCYIFDKMEDMNVWVKDLSTE